MNIEEKIHSFVGNHSAPYMYSSENFKPGITPIRYSGPYWDHKEIEAAINAFLNGSWISAGDNVYKFEKAFSRKFNIGYSLMVNSGSSANLVMIASLKKYWGWVDFSEIIVSPVGFPTTISVLYQNRLKPIFVDTEWGTLNFDLNKIEDKVTTRTRGIFLSPVLGNPPDIDALLYICDKYDLVLIGDNCDSLSSKWKGKYLNEYCMASSNSFYAAHTICTGQGGMVCTDDDKLFDIMQSIAEWGRSCRCRSSANMSGKGTCGHRFDKWIELYDGIVDHKYVFSNMGYNLKPLDLQGAIGSVQLEKFDEIERKRKISKKVLTKIFIDNIPSIKSVETLQNADVCWFGTPFICEETGLKHRLVAHLEKNLIQTRNYFAGNILLHPGFQFMDDYRDYPEANKILDKVFFIGASPSYNQTIFGYIEEVIKKFKE
jgi:CDP-6-deoxy-D-xylo-4-hexulose-3-dehydrase